MNMIKETYERLTMDVTKFDVEDVITTSGVGPSTDPDYDWGDYELGTGGEGIMPPGF